MNENYIAGFFDADGYLTLNKGVGNEEYTPCLGFTNNVKEILEDIKKFIFELYGIKGCISLKKKSKEHHNDSFDLKYSGFKKCIMILDNIPIKHPKKVKRLEIVKVMQKLTPRNGKYKKDTLFERREFCKKFFEVI